MGRIWKRGCYAVLAIAALACNDSPTAVRPRPTAPSKDIDVSTGTLSLQFQFGGAALATLNLSANYYCSWQLWMDPAPPDNPNGKFIEGLCEAPSVDIPALPPGDHTFQLRDAAQNGYLLGEGQATLVAGQTTTLTIDFSQHASLVKGTLSANAATPSTYEYVVCPVVNRECYYVSSTDGTFAYVDVAGSRSATFQGANTNAKLATFSYATTVGNATDLGTVQIQSGKLDLQLLFGGTSLATLGVSPNQSCPFLIYIDPPAANQVGDFVRYLCNSDVTASPLTVGPLPTGTHTFQVYYGGTIVSSVSTSITAGAKTSQGFELGGTMGLITGKLTAGGAPPTQDFQYLACSFTSACYYAAKTTGDFKYVELAGQRTETLQRANATGGAQIQVTLAAGETKDLGTVSADAASATIDIRFAGESMNTKLSQGQSALAMLYRDPTSTNPNGQFVQYVYNFQLSNPSYSIDGLPIGTHTFQLRQYPSGTLLASTTADLTSGQQTPLTFDVTGTVGFVSGVLKINGNVPAAYAYLICPTGQQCSYVTDPTGAFAYFDLPGARTATVRGSSTNVDISSFGYSVTAGLTTLVGTTTGGASGNTSTGVNVTVKPIDSNTGTQTITLTFGTVTGTGQTTVSQGHSGPNPPPGQKGGNPIWYYYIATSATFTGSVQVCINYDPTAFTNTSKLALQHYDETASKWTDVTTSNDQTAGVLCGSVTSFSPFLITEPADLPPTASATFTPTAVAEGQTVTFDGSKTSDPNGDALLYAWDFGDGSHGTGATATHAYADNGSYTAKLTVTENGAEGLTSSASVSVTVTNVAPTGTLSAPATVVEGSSFSLALTNVTDPSPVDVESGLKIEYDCGAGFVSSGNCGLAVDGPATRVVRARVTDKDGGSNTYSASVTILNANPVVNAFAGASIVSGQTFTVASSFSDAGASDAPWTVLIDWNDGPAFSTSVTTQGSVGSSHRYLVPGTYLVRLTITDKDGGASSQAATVVVTPLPIAVDIQPGMSPNTVSIKKPGSTLPVAILGTATFDATTVDPATITLGNESGVDTPVARSSTGTLVVNAPFDINGDGRPDLVVHFYIADLKANGDLNMTAGTTQTLVLRGKTKSPDGRSVRGADQIAITP